MTADRAHREAMLRLGQAGPARAFVEAAAGWEELDPALRFLLASNLVKLGFRTLALEQIGLLGAEAARHSDVARLSAAAESLSPDELTRERRRELLAANCAALAERGALEPGEAAELAEPTGDEVYRGLGGTVLRRAPGAGHTGWRLSARMSEPGAFEDWEVQPPLVVVGLSPADLVRAMIDATPGAGEGGRLFGRRLLVVEEERATLREALEVADLSGAIRLERTRWFVGAGALGRLERYLMEGLDLALPERCMFAPGSEAKVERVGAVLRRAQAAQATALDDMRGRANAAYAERGQRRWAERFAAIAEGRAGGDRPRVLVPTCRFSTFVRHSSADIASAFERLGWEARVLIEPDAESRLAATAYWRAFAEFRPDLVVSVNYPRAMLPGLIPANVPFVCWVQDAMSHLFDAKVGAAQGPLDLLVGHVHPELVREFGYPASRTLPTPVLVNEQKFHEGPVTGADRVRFECEVAYVSHQSETAEACRDRLAAAYAGRSAGLARAVEAMFGEVVRIATGGLETAMAAALEEAARAALRAALGREPDAGEMAEAVNGAARPMAERAMRHQMLAWAAELCREEGWRLHLYGKGWAGHPTLGAYAKGELGHGEELRAAYQCARVHLHAGLGSVHQRVMECAMSGGATLVRWKRDDFELLEWWAQETVAASRRFKLEEYAPLAGGVRCFVRPADHWPMLMTTALRDRLGLADPYRGLDLRYIAPSQAEQPWRERNGVPLSFEEAWLIGDPSEVGFWSRETLGAALRRAIGSERYRAGVSRWQRRGASRFTYLRLVERLIGFIGESLRRNDRVAAAA